MKFNLFKLLAVIYTIVVLLMSFSIGFSQSNSIPANGKIVFASNRDGNYEIYTMNPDGSHQQRMTTDDGMDLYPNWSPDGQKIVFVSDRRNNVAAYEMYVMNADGTIQTRLSTTENLSQDTSPQWSPNGDKIAFVRQNRARLDIYTINTNGTGLINLTETQNEYVHRTFSWSPDGKQILFAASTETGYTILDADSKLYAMNTDGSEVTPIYRGVIGYGHPEISPDNKKIVYYDLDPANYFQIMTMNRDGSGISYLTVDNAEHENPAWSPDGSHVVFEVGDTKHDIATINRDGTGLINLTNSEDFDDIQPDWQPIFVASSPTPTSSK